MKWGEMKASSRKRMKKSCAAIQLPSQFLYIHPCHFFGQNDSLSFCSSVKAFRQEQVTIMPKRLIAMKLFMKERLLILTILDISHKIAEFIEEVNHHATIASRLGNCPFSGNSHGFHGMKDASRGSEFTARNAPTIPVAVHPIAVTLLIMECPS